MCRGGGRSPPWVFEVPIRNFSIPKNTCLVAPMSHDDRYFGIGWTVLRDDRLSRLFQRHVWIFFAIDPNEYHVRILRRFIRRRFCLQMNNCRNRRLNGNSYENNANLDQHFIRIIFERSLYACPIVHSTVVLNRSKLVGWTKIFAAGTTDQIVHENHPNHK